MKALLCCILLLSVPKVANAQVRIGAVAGANIGSFTLPKNLSPTATRESKTGMAVGVAAEVQLSQQWRLRIEPRYIQKGFRTVIIDATGTTRSSQSVNYFELPLMAVVLFGETGIQPFLFAGPDFAFLLSASENATLSNGQTLPTLDTQSNYKPVEFVLEGGGGVEYALTPNISILGIAGYSIGISNVYQVPTYEGRTRGLHLLIGCLLTLP